MNLTAILQALGDQTRLRIVEQLADGESRMCGTFDHLGVASSTLSHHFRVLRDAGLIETRVEGTKRLNSLRRREVDAAFPGLLDSVLGATAEASRAAAR